MTRYYDPYDGEPISEVEMAREVLDATEQAQYRREVQGRQSGHRGHLTPRPRVAVEEDDTDWDVVEKYRARADERWSA